MELFVQRLKVLSQQLSVLSRSLTYIIISNIEIHILFPIAANLNFVHGVFSVAVKFIDNNSLWWSGKHWARPNQGYSINYKEEVDFITMLAKKAINSFIWPIFFSERQNIIQGHTKTESTQWNVLHLEGRDLAILGVQLIYNSPHYSSTVEPTQWNTTSLK